MSALIGADLAQIGQIRLIIGLDLPVGRLDLDLARHAEADHAGKHDQIAPVARLGELGDPPKPADTIKRRAILALASRGCTTPIIRSPATASDTIAR